MPGSLNVVPNQLAVGDVVAAGRWRPAYGEVEAEDFGAVLNPEGSPSDVTLAMLTGQGR
jgi:hypothetical protein